MGLDLVVVVFLEGEFSNVGEADHFCVGFELGLSELIEEDVESALIPIGVAEGVVLLFEIVGGGEVAIDHGVGRDALETFIFDEQQISRIYS